jgi:hypothetical protein
MILSEEQIVRKMILEIITEVDYDYSKEYDRSYIYKLYEDEPEVLEYELDNLDEKMGKLIEIVRKYLK